MGVFPVQSRRWLVTTAFVALFGIECTAEQVQQCIDRLVALGISEQTSTNTCVRGAGFGEFNDAP